MKPPKRPANLKFLKLENTKRNSERALRAGTARNECLK